MSAHPQGRFGSASLIATARGDGNQLEAEVGEFAYRALKGRLVFDPPDEVGVPSLDATDLESVQKPIKARA
jgi:hypothetical protein